MKQLLIIGASSHGKVVADIARLNDYERVLFFDDNVLLKKCGTDSVVGISSDVDDYDGDVIIAIGNAKIREKIQNSMPKRNFPVLIHPNAVVADSASIGAGTVVMAGAIINPFATIGEGCIINTCASVDHDCNIGSYVHISVGSHIAGTANVGNRTWIGIGASVSNNLNICNDCMIGAGAVVIRDIDEKGTYVGVPSRKVK